MSETLLSITIRPPQAEFSSIKDAIDLFIEYMKPNEYIVSLEKGQKKGQTPKKGDFNHYQIAYISAKHIDTIRRAINRFFKPHLSPSTLKKGVWKKCIKHNNKTSLLGYCQKEGQIYSTNIEESKLKAELELYNSQISKNKAKSSIEWPSCKKCDTPLLANIPPYCSNQVRFDYIFYNYFCKPCNRIRFPLFN